MNVFHISQGPEYEPELEPSGRTFWSISGGTYEERERVKEVMLTCLDSGEYEL